MITFLIIVIFIIVIAYLIGKTKTTKSTSTKSKTPSLKTRPIKSKKNENSFLYKNTGIRVFDLKGMYYQKLNPNTDNGGFYGFAKCEDNTHDKYAVGIYNTQLKLLGYTTKRNKRLNLSLKEWHN